MLGMFEKVINERKGAIDLLLIVIPASIFANLLSDYLSGVKLVCVEILIAISMLLILLLRYLNSLIGKTSEYIFAKEITYNKNLKKLASDFKGNAGHSFSLGIENVFNALKAKVPNLVDEFSTKGEKEMWAVILDFYEIVIMASITFGNWGGWKITQTSRNTYSTENIGGFTEISFDEGYPARLKEENLVFKNIPEKFTVKPGVGYFFSKFNLPPKSKFEYERDLVNDNRSLIFDNEKGCIRINISSSYSMSPDWRLGSQSGVTSFRPIIHFWFESKSSMALSGDYVEYLLWVERCFVLLKNDLE